MTQIKLTENEPNIHALYDPEPEKYGFSGEIFVTRFKNVYNVMKFFVERE